MGKQTVRKAYGSAGKGIWKKRMPFCNGTDRDFNVISRENGQTSIRFLITRKSKEF